MDRSIVTRRMHSVPPPAAAAPKKSFAQTYVVPNLFTLLFAVVLILGVVTGSLLTKSIDLGTLSDLGLVTLEFIKVKVAQSFWQNFVFSFTSGFIYLFVLFLMGFTAISQPLMLGVVFFKGLGLGLSMGYAYSTMGQSGILASMVFLLPNALFISFAILWAAKESFKLSVLFFCQLLPNQSESRLGKMAKKLCVKYISITAFYLAGCALEAGIISLFGQFFASFA
ncbi:stage II sporulation protein M [Zongyangia hominis]|uniref:Stage II sporulation protein M n=1 Tax=Zongyangia hominis TaxID=2763677 RepID=A0A926IAU6_9FIRM|nr:stage II sporulation protein M [Zongyangia hominis]MBC8569583.1 hypothetical protein [Zongyangia hominis]